MSKKPNILSVLAGFLSAKTINENFTRIADAFENTLSRDGSLPNHMNADIDMNSNDILNVNKVTANELVIEGDDVSVIKNWAKEAERWAGLAHTSSDISEEWAGVSEEAAELAIAVAGAGATMFSTREAVKNTTIPPFFTHLQTAGYSEVGDGGGALYKRVEDEPVHAGKVQSKDGAWWELAEKQIKPYYFGAKGDGVADDGDALNVMFDYVRYLSNQNLSITSFNAGIFVDMSNGVYRTTKSINVTGIVGWSLKIFGGLIVGECTGKAIFDLVGSRGYELNSVAFHGSRDNMPSCAYQLARPSAAGFSDNNTFNEVSTTGWFSRAAVHCYAHETTTHIHCTYFNYHYDAYVAIFDGYSTFPFTSDYSTVMSGGTSFINNKIINCDFRYLPSLTPGNAANITGVSNAVNGVITCPNHSFEIGDIVVFDHVGGMRGMSSLRATILDVSESTITIDQSTVDLGTYTSGGRVLKAQTKSSVYVGRAEQFNFDCTYIVAYGAPQLTLGFSDPNFTRMEQLDLDLLFEGSGNSANIFLATYGRSVSIQGFRLKTYNSNARYALINIDNSSGSNAGIYHPYIESVDALFNPDLVLNPNRIAMFGADILFQSKEKTVYGSMVAFNGKITELGTGRSYNVGQRNLGNIYYESTTVAPSAGALVGYLAVDINGRDYKIPFYAQ